MLTLYINCLSLFYIVNCTSTDEKLKELNILVDNDVWLEFENSALPIDNSLGKSQKITFSELFSRSNGAVFTNENYLNKSKHFHTMLSCNFAVAFEYLTNLMKDLWMECGKCIPEPKKKENRSSEESGNEDNCKENLVNILHEKFETFSKSIENENDSNKEFDDEIYCKPNLENVLCKKFEIISKPEEKENRSNEESNDEDICKENLVNISHEKFETFSIPKENENNAIKEFDDEIYCKENLENVLCEKFEIFSKPDEKENGSSEESDDKEYCNDLIMLVRQALSYFTQISDTEEKESILPALDIVTQFANNELSIDSIYENVLKMKNILNYFIKNNCWFNENRKDFMLESLNCIIISSHHYDNPISRLTAQIQFLYESFIFRTKLLGFKNM